METFLYRTRFAMERAALWNHLLQEMKAARLIPPWFRHARVLQVGSPLERGARTYFRYGRTLCLERMEVVLNDTLVDLQVRGPFRQMRHQVRLLDAEAGVTELEDAVAYRLFPWHSYSRFQDELTKFFVWRHETLLRDAALFSRFKTAPLRILVSGSHGMVGRGLVSLLCAAGHEVICLVRGKASKSIDTICWDPKRGRVRMEDFERFDAVFHLAGETISHLRWTKRVQEKIFRSRARDTWFLSQLLLRLKQPPKTVITASAVGFYGDRGEELLTEQSGRGEGFLANVVQEWEGATESLAQAGIRVAHARFGAILSRSGGMLKKMLPAYRLGLGPILGSGQQFLSWISLDDALHALYTLLMDQTLQGAVNVSSPQPVRQEFFAEVLSSMFDHKVRLKISPAFIKILFGDMGKTLLLGSTHALPEKLLSSGFVFSDPTLEQAFFRTGLSV